MKPLTILLVAALAQAPLSYAQAGCGHLFHHQQHVVAVQPQVFYFAGQAVQDEALVRRVIREELKGITQQLQAPTAAPVASSVLSAKCARCHQGESAKGGVNFADGIDDLEFRQTVRVLSGYDVPAPMKALIGSLSPQDKGAITQEMLGLPAKPEEPAVAPSPFDQPGELK